MTQISSDAIRLSINETKIKATAMGIRIGIGNRIKIGGGGGGGQSWASYWASQPEVLFFGLYSDISGGQMPNRKSGSSDYLTVTGAAGSETYQCPNTAPYITADTDRIWFNTDVIQRVPTTAELVGYDFTRTIVKYANASPHAIEAIMILSSDYVTDKMRDDFMLSIWWDNTLSDHGFLKENRGAERSVWINAYAILGDGNTVGWYDSQILSTITKDESNIVSKWEDALLSGNDLVPVAALAERYPTWSSDGILFDGTKNHLRDAFTYDSPQCIYIVLKQITWTLNDILFDGYTAATMPFSQYQETPKLLIKGCVQTTPPIDTYFIARIRLKNGSNKFTINNGSAVTSTQAAVNAGGFAIGGNGNGGQCANLQVKEIILRAIDETEEYEKIIYNYLAQKYGFDLI